MTLPQTTEFDAIRRAPSTAIWKALFRLASVGLVACAGLMTLAWVTQYLEGLSGPQAQMIKWGTVIALLLVYAVLLGVPFVPGVEIGIGLMVALGPQMAPLVYLATVLGLLAAFALGRWAELGAVGRMLQRFGLYRASRWIDNLGRHPTDARLDTLSRSLPAWLRPVARRFHCVSLAVLLNLPGNSILGGGGGIMIFAGMVGAFRLWTVAITVALAVSPVPIMVWVFGTGILT